MSSWNTTAFTQSDWDFIIENVVNNSSLKFGNYVLHVDSGSDTTFNLNNDRRLRIFNSYDVNLTLKGKMGEIEYQGNTNYLKVEGEFEDIVDLKGNPISHKLFDYENLPDLYESLDERLRRLTSL